MCSVYILDIILIRFHKKVQVKIYRRGGGVKIFRRRLPWGLLSHRRRGETRGGRVPQKSENWGVVFYGWSLKLKVQNYSLLLKERKITF